jgi:hypothetical protein
MRTRNRNYVKSENEESLTSCSVKREKRTIPALEDCEDESLTPSTPVPRYIRGAKKPRRWSGLLSDSISTDYHLTWAQVWRIFDHDYKKWKHIDVSRIAAKNAIPPEARRMGCHKSTLLDCANQFCTQGLFIRFFCLTNEGLLAYVLPSDSPYSSSTSFLPTETFLKKVPAKDLLPIPEPGPVVVSPEFDFQVIEGPKQLKWKVRDTVSGKEYAVSIREVTDSALPVALAFGKALVAYEEL